MSGRSGGGEGRYGSSIDRRLVPDMIHLTLIIVDFLTGLLAAGAWALASAGGAIAAVVGGGVLGVSLFRRWRRKP